MTVPPAALIASSQKFIVTDAICLILLIFCLVCSAFFSASETAFSGINMIRMKNYAEEKRKGARRALYIMEHFDKTLSTILVGNNFVNIASTTICAYLFGKFILNPTLANVLNTVIMTIIILIFGEIIPKSLAKANPEKTAMRYSGMLFVIMKILTPITFFFGLLQKAALKKVKTSDEPTVTEDELESIIDTMEEEGVIDHDNKEIIQGAINLSELCAYDVMTHRKDAVFINQDATIEEAKKTFIDTRFSRIPVFKDNRDNVVGILNQKDVFSALLLNKKLTIEKIMNAPHFVSEEMKLDDLIRELVSEWNEAATYLAGPKITPKLSLDKKIEEASLKSASESVVKIQDPKSKETEIIR